jgi:predicted nucleic acid-binding protein
MHFVDTNIFIRHLTGDDPIKAQACYELFKRAATDTITLTTTEAVIAEVVFVLSSKRLYNLPRQRIRELLYPLLNLKGFQLPQRPTLFRALDLYELYNLDFEDTLVIAHMERQNLKDMYSYDRGFDKIPEIIRHEP